MTGAETPGSRTIRIRRIRATGEGPRDECAQEHVVLEEPLEIRLDGEPVAVTMRTPGHDVELATGFLTTEGVIRDATAFATATHCDDADNVIDVCTVPGATGVHRPAPRSFPATASCGVCGKTSIDEVRVRCRSLSDDDTRISPALLAALPARLREGQPLFARTGALHAAGLFSAAGELLCLREDVGRHNAVDKVIGWATLRRRLPLAGHVLVVSGRSGFEIVQKAAVAGIPVLAGISGTSSLAVSLADEGGLTLVAFLRGEGMNVCTHPERICAS